MFNSGLKKYGYLWVTLFLFTISFIAHWYFAWESYVLKQQQDNQPVVVREYVAETLTSTFENWQSEFLQLMWQVAGLSFLFYVGSPQSKEGQERQEKKIDMILKKLDPKDAEREISNLQRKYPLK